jgi:hypothetical protein
MIHYYHTAIADCRILSLDKSPLSPLVFRGSYVLLSIFFCIWVDILSIHSIWDMRINLSPILVIYPHTIKVDCCMILIAAYPFSY